MILLLLQVLIWMVGCCLLLTFPVLLWIVCIDLRDRLRRGRPEPVCACGSKPLDIYPVYDGALLHEEHRCYPHIEAVR